jgi:hypothetical protein
MLRLHGPLADLNHVRLFGRRLREVMSETLGEPGALALQVGHE